MVGGMRVRTANRRRSSVAEEKEEEEEQDIEEQENDHERRHQQNQQRQRAYQAARDAQLPRHPHTNHQPRIDPSFQPRDLNH